MCVEEDVQSLTSCPCYRFHSAFNDAVNPLKLDQAIKAGHAVQDGKYADIENPWPLLAKDGDMMSYLDSISAGAVRPLIISGLSLS